MEVIWNLFSTIQKPQFCKKNIFMTSELSPYLLYLEVGEFVSYVYILLIKFEVNKKKWKKNVDLWVMVLTFHVFKKNFLVL